MVAPSPRRWSPVRLSGHTVGSCFVAVLSSGAALRGRDSACALPACRTLCLPCPFSGWVLAGCPSFQRSVYATVVGLCGLSSRALVELVLGKPGLSSG